MKTISDTCLSPVNSPKEIFVKTALAASGFHEFKSTAPCQQQAGDKALERRGARLVGPGVECH